MDWANCHQGCTKIIIIIIIVKCGSLARLGVKQTASKYCHVSSCLRKLVSPEGWSVETEEHHTCSPSPLPMPCQVATQRLCDKICETEQLLTGSRCAYSFFTTGATLCQKVLELLVIPTTALPKSHPSFSTKASPFVISQFFTSFPQPLPFFKLKVLFL